MLNQRSLTLMDPQTNKRDRLLLLFRQKARLMEALHPFKSSFQQESTENTEKKSRCDDIQEG